MDAPPLPARRKRVGETASAAPPQNVSSGATAGRDHPAADWICVAAARDILVVDDNDRHLDILGTILTSVGHEVETCGSGAEALRRLDARHFDVVVLDLIMPEISGLVVAQQMAVSALNRETPIIVCTANMTIARRQLADLHTVVGIIGKPIDTASLVLAVARAPARQGERDRKRKADQLRM